MDGNACVRDLLADRTDLITGHVSNFIKKDNSDIHAKRTKSKVLDHTRNQTYQRAVIRLPRFLNVRAM